MVTMEETVIHRMAQERGITDDEMRVLLTKAAQEIIKYNGGQPVTAESLIQEIAKYVENSMDGSDTQQFDSLN